MTLPNSQTWTPQDDLEWLAFRYISGELTDGELSDFETRLAEDQVAREAVARSVQMTHAVVSLAEAETAGPVLVRPLFRWQRMHTWAASAVAVVAIITAFVAGTNYSDPNNRPEKTVSQTPAPQEKDSDNIAESLVLAWVNSAEMDAEETVENGGFPRFEETAQAGPTFLAAETEVVVEGDFDWVVAALDDTPANGIHNDNPENREPN